MSDSHNLLSPLFDDPPNLKPLNIISPHEPDESHSDPVAASRSKVRSIKRPRKDEKDPGPTPHDEVKPKYPAANPAANDQDPKSDSASALPKETSKSDSKDHRGKNHEEPPSRSVAVVAPPVNSPVPSIPSSSTMRKHGSKNEAPTTSLPTLASFSSVSYSESTSSSALTMPITTTHLATVTSYTYLSSVSVSDSQIYPTLVNENANADSSSGSSDANIAVPIIISVLAGVFLVAVIVFVMSKMKQKRKNRETWSMYREEPWRNPFRESLDQYHSHY
jgi:hypothetical protein